MSNYGDRQAGWRVVARLDRRGAQVQPLPIRAEAARILDVVHSSAPLQFAADAGHPYRAAKDDQPRCHHQRMKENGVVEAIAKSCKKNKTHDADQRDGGYRDGIAS
jgi:hypothetical protein